MLKTFAVKLASKCEKAVALSEPWNGVLSETQFLPRGWYKPTVHCTEDTGGNTGVRLADGTEINSAFQM